MQTETVNKIQLNNEAFSVSIEDNEIEKIKCFN